mgnify:CR=1 FL=1
MARYRAAIIKEQLHMTESYFERDRGYGQGNYRIGQSLEMEDSIYSLGFLSQLEDVIIDPKFDVISGHLIDVEVEESELSGTGSSSSVATTDKGSEADSDEGEDEDKGKSKEEG